MIPRLLNWTCLDKIYQIPSGRAKSLKILPLVSLSLKTMILETLPPFFSSVGLIWFGAPGPLGEPQVHHQPGTYEINAVIFAKNIIRSRNANMASLVFSHRVVSRTVHTTFHHSHLDARLAAIALLQTLCFHIKSAFFTWRFFLIGIFCPKAADQEGLH